MFMTQKLPTSTWVYKRKETEHEHYILDDGGGEREMDYLETEKDVLNRINTVMDTQTELYVIPAKEALNSPISDGYFIY